MLYKDEQQGAVTFFRFEDIVAYPTFTLNGYARYYVIKGSLRMAGKEHFPGTFIHCDDGTLIDPVPTEAPCIVLCNYEKMNFRKVKI